MKKYLLGAMAVGLVFTGCVNDNVAEFSAEDNLKPITFEVAKYKASTRADGDGQSVNGHTAFPTNQVFGAFAWKSSSINGEHSLYMDNARIGYVGTYWAATDDTYYWPTVGHLDFVSYYPYSATASPCIPDLSVNNQLTYTNYKVQEGVDLLYSDKTHLQTANVSTSYGFTGVPTLFRHALARLNFKVRATTNQTTVTVPASGTTPEHTATFDWQVAVQSISISSIKDEGSVTLKTTSPSEAGTSQWENNNANNVWTPTTSLISKEWTADGGSQVLGTTTAGSYFSNAYEYYVLPQMFENQSITIKYTIANKVSTANTYEDADSFEKTFTFAKIDELLSVNNTAIFGWKMGKNITYLIEIDPLGDIIHFAPAVSDWEEVSGGTASF